MSSQKAIFHLAILVIFCFIFPTLARESFDECGARIESYLANGTNVSIAIYEYHGPAVGLIPGRPRPFLISEEGCNHFCGSKPKYYSWTQVSDTITTWVLPIAGGLLLQLPYESNTIFANFLAICRWAGNPIMTITCTLWNIKTTGHCALLVDMSVGRKILPGYQNPRRRVFWRTLWKQYRGIDHSSEDEIINVNAYGPDSDPRNTIHALPDEVHRNSCTNELVPSQCGTSSTINIDHALPGSQQYAHDFSDFRDSMYILSVLNQYSFYHGETRSNIHSLAKEVLKDVKFALFDVTSEDLRQRRRELAISLRRERKHGIVQLLISLFWFLVSLTISIYKAFGDIGINTTAHNLALGLLMGWLPVLVSSNLIDRNPASATYTMRRLEGFLKTAKKIQLDIPLNSLKEPSRYLDQFCGQARRKWHYGIAHSILRDNESQFPNERRRGFLTAFQLDNLSQPADEQRGLWRFDVIEIWQMLTAAFVVIASIMGAFTISYNTPTVGLGCRSGGYMVFGLLAVSCFLFEILGWAMHKHGKVRDERLAQWIVQGLRVFITLLEIANVGWLTYVIFAQTVGSYNVCSCRSSPWGSIGGYTDFMSAVTYLEDYDVYRFWAIGTAVGMAPLAVIFYIVYEWCTQSFLWSEDYDAAMRGLRRVRRWKYVFHIDWLHKMCVVLPYWLVGKTYSGVAWRR